MCESVSIRLVSARWCLDGFGVTCLALYYGLSMVVGVIWSLALLSTFPIPLSCSSGLNFISPGFFPYSDQIIKQVQTNICYTNLIKSYF